MFAFLMGLKSVSPKALHAELHSRQLVVIDVNSRQSWVKAHVPGALHLDPAAYGGHDLPADKHASLVFYCSNPMCRKAPTTAARRAKTMGYAGVRARALGAGINGWLAAKLPTEPAA